MSSKKYEHLFSILKLGWRVLFILILYLLLANVKFFPYHSRTIECLLFSYVTLTNLFSKSQEWTFWNYSFFCTLAPEKRMWYDSRCAFRRVLPQHNAKASRAGLRVPLMIRFDGTSSVGISGNDPKTTNNGNLHHSVKFGKNVRSIGRQMRPQNHLKSMRGQKILCCKLLIISFGSISLKLYFRDEKQKK